MHIPARIGINAHMIRPHSITQRFRTGSLAAPDGEEILREQDRGARIDLLEEILSISDLGLESQKELLEVLEKHRQEFTN